MPADIRLDADNGESLVLQGQGITVSGESLVLQGQVITVDGRLNLKPTTLQGQRSFPTDATIGDVYMLITEQEGFGGTHFTTTSLWLCVPPEQPSVAGVAASWREIQLGPLTLGG